MQYEVITHVDYGTGRTEPLHKTYNQYRDALQAYNDIKIEIDKPDDGTSTGVPYAVSIKPSAATGNNSFAIRAELSAGVFGTQFVGLVVPNSVTDKTTLQNKLRAMVNNWNPETDTKIEFEVDYTFLSTPAHSKLYINQPLALIYTQ